MEQLFNRITFAKKLYLAASLCTVLMIIAALSGILTAYRIARVAVIDGADTMNAVQLRAALTNILDVQHSIAGNAIWIVAIQVIVESAMIMFTLLVMKNTMSDPMTQLADVTTTLAGGHDMEVPFQARADEIGAVALAVESFRKAASQRASDDAARAVEQKIITQNLGDGLSALSRGDLTFTIKQGFPSGYAALKDDFNGAVSTLASLMNGVTATSGAVRTGASEMSNAALDLAHRTEQQAASLQETAATVRELTTSVSEAARSADSASKSAQTARDDAQSSGAVVREAINAMNSISRSSELMGNVVALIDGIAFQTNLLALNAGVEAARAGEVGAGFAVVANEVRALSLRATEAAKEIGALISESGREVANGVQLVNKAGTALAKIELGAVEVSGLIAQIASAAKQQASAIQQVNTMVDSMDRTTQLNAALVEETTAASQNLAGQADHLAKLVGQFELEKAATRTSGQAVGPLRLAS